MRTRRGIGIKVHTVAGGVLLASDKSLGVEETPVGARPDFVDHVGLEVNIQGSGHMLARRRFREESAKSVIVSGGRVLR